MPDNTMVDRLAFEVTMNGERVLGQNLLLDDRHRSADFGTAMKIADSLMATWVPLLAKAIVKGTNDHAN